MNQLDYSYEEVRDVTLDILAGRELVGDPVKSKYDNGDYQKLQKYVAEVLTRGTGRTHNLSYIFHEVFFVLFQQGVIIFGSDPNNIRLDRFKVSPFGKKFLNNTNLYFFHDVLSYEKVIKEQIPKIEEVTLKYLKESMQAFMSNCMLASTVMLGVSVEDLFQKLLETIEQNPKYNDKFKNVFTEKTISQKLAKFNNILVQCRKDFSKDIQEGLETNFNGIIEMIRNFRNDCGHPTGKIIIRDQCFINLQLFIPYAKKIYQLIDFFKQSS